jgi:hypothetical protein
MMDSLAARAVCLVVVVAHIKNAVALQCFKCVNVAQKADNILGGAVKDKIQEHTQINCKYPWLGDVDTVTCDDDTSTCGYISGTVEANIPLIGRFSTQFEVRDCVLKSQYQEDGCLDKITDSASKILNGVLSILDMSILNVKGRSCFCSDDLCDAQCPNGLFIQEKCIPYWAIAVAAVAVLVLLGACVTCCCCCCCSCCRSKPHRGAVLHTPGTGTVLVVNTPAGQGYSRFTDETNAIA